jgi:hypothetical protein
MPMQLPPNNVSSRVCDVIQIFQGKSLTRRKIFLPLLLAFADSAVTILILPLPICFPVIIFICTFSRNRITYNCLRISKSLWLIEIVKVMHIANFIKIAYLKPQNKNIAACR